MTHDADQIVTDAVAETMDNFVVVMLKAGLSPSAIGDGMQLAIDRLRSMATSPHPSATPLH